MSCILFSSLSLSSAFFSTDTHRTRSWKQSNRRPRCKVSRRCFRKQQGKTHSLFASLLTVCNFLTQTLKKLDLSRNEIGDQGANCLATALKTNTVNSISYSLIPLTYAFFTQTLIQLRLYKNRIRDQGAIDLASALENKTVNCILY